MQIGNIPKYVEGDILIAHIRGEVPPHITEEFDFAKIAQWPLVLLGDLHFQHRYKNYNMFYSGSPVNTSFDRSASNKYGVNIISLELGEYSVEFIDLDLPKLIRKTVTSEKELVQDRVHHVIYEVVGSIDTLSKITNHELLDKKIAEKPSEASVLELSNKTINEELALYLEYLKVENIEKVLELFKELEIRP
jgi:DNA repair exonuclease SbcCD nuclease subunit